MTTAILYAGPSVSQALRTEYAAYDWRSPVAEGDVLRATATSPPAIGIIDGFFESRPPVRHKEILHALTCGIHVFGAASMGALRAAELHTYGMVGIGQIFEAYRAGLLDDDEVAVEHGPMQLGYPATSEAMVNVRATLDAAARCRIVTIAESHALAALAKSIFFKERTWGHILQTAAANGHPTAALHAWLKRGRVDQKRLDAAAMLKALQMFLSRNPQPFKPNFELAVPLRLARALHRHSP